MAKIPFENAYLENLMLAHFNLSLASQQCFVSAVHHPRFDGPSIIVGVRSSIEGYFLVQARTSFSLTLFHAKKTEGDNLQITREILDFSKSGVDQEYVCSYAFSVANMITEWTAGDIEEVSLAMKNCG